VLSRFLEFPVAGLLCGGLIVFGFSRVMVALSKNGAIVVFAVVGVIVMGLAVLLGTRPKVSRTVVGGVLSVSAIIALVAGVAYVRAERRVRRERGDRRFPRARGRQFLAGLAIVLIALESPIDTASTTSFSVHMVQHLLLTMVAAPLLVLGAPVTLALLSCSPANRRRLSAALTHPPLRSLSHPIVAWAVFFGVLWGSHLTGLFDASLRSDGVHALEHAAYLATAVLFWMPVVGRDPAPLGLSHPGRILYLFLAMASMAFLGLALFSANHALYPTYAAVEGSAKALADQGVGGTLMWLGGMVFIVPALALVMLDWMRVDEREARRMDARLLRPLAPTSGGPRR
jgi:putative copper resistance protein D